jgi:hypothetical protein
MNDQPGSDDYVPSSDIIRRLNEGVLYEPDDSIDVVLTERLMREAAQRIEALEREVKDAMHILSPLIDRALPDYLRAG